MNQTLENLIEVMNEELQSQRDLAQMLENKLDAMRHYDISRLEALSISEQRLLDLMGHIGRRRTDAVAAATDDLLPTQPVGRVSVAQLAERASIEQRNRLLALAALLKDVAQQVQRLNRVNALATNKILGHFDGIFRIIAQAGRDIGLYGSAGKKALLEQNRLFDAIA